MGVPLKKILASVGFPVISQMAEPTFFWPPPDLTEHWAGQGVYTRIVQINPVLCSRPGWTDWNSGHDPVDDLKALFAAGASLFHKGRDCVFVMSSVTFLDAARGVPPLYYDAKLPRLILCTHGAWLPRGVVVLLAGRGIGDRLDEGPNVTILDLMPEDFDLAYALITI